MATIHVCIDGDMLDNICYKHYGSSSRAVEAVLNANPNLADLGAVYSFGTKIFLPDFPEETIRPLLKRKIKVFE